MISESLVRLRVNDDEVILRVDPWMTLADCLRDKLHLNGTRIGCAEGVCGSCTVLVDDTPLRSCLTLAAQVDGCSVKTVESYADDSMGQAIQQGFVDHFAAQCGFCTSGMMAIVRDFLNDASIPDHGDEAVIREMLNASICRCTGYEAIVTAVQSIAKKSVVRAYG